MTTSTGRGFDFICPSWCDNHCSGAPHAADDVGSEPFVMHRQRVARGEGWEVEVYASHDRDGVAEPVVTAHGTDFEDLHSLQSFMAALTQAACVAASAGMRSGL